MTDLDLDLDLGPSLAPGHLPGSNPDRHRKLVTKTKKEENKNKKEVLN